jgi:hypothetical protein
VEKRRALSDCDEAEDRMKTLLIIAGLGLAFCCFASAGLLLIGALASDSPDESRPPTPPRAQTTANGTMVGKWKATDLKKRCTDLSVDALIALSRAPLIQTCHPAPPEFWN